MFFLGGTEMDYRNYFQKNLQRFEIREGGGCLSAFGLPFLCAGIFLLLSSLSIIPFQNKNEIPPWAFIIMFFMSLPFIGVGGALFFGRRLTRIELAEGRIFKESKIFVPVKNESYLITDYKTVSIRFNAGDSDSGDSYPVGLIPSNAGSLLSLYSGTTYADAREFAATLSQFLKFPLEEETTGHKSLVEPEDAKKSLRDRITSGTDTEKATRPFLMRSEVIEESGTLRIRIPPTGFKMTLLIPLAILFLAMVYLFFRLPAILDFFQRTSTPRMVQCFLFGFAGLFILLPVFQAIRRVIVALRGDTVLEVGPEVLVISDRKPWSMRTVRIPIQEIYDMDYDGRELFQESIRDSVRERVESAYRGREIVLSQQAYGDTWWFKLLQRMVPSKGITFKTRKALFSFGAGLGDEELRFLCSLIKNKIAKV